MKKKKTTNGPKSCSPHCSHIDARVEIVNTQSHRYICRSRVFGRTVYLLCLSQAFFQVRRVFLGCEDEFNFQIYTVPIERKSTVEYSTVMDLVYYGGENGVVLMKRHARARVLSRVDDDGHLAAAAAGPLLTRRNDELGVFLVPHCVSVEWTCTKVRFEIAEDEIWSLIVGKIYIYIQGAGGASLWE